MTASRISMIATARLVHGGKMLHTGEPFTVLSEQEANDLIALRFAKLVPTPVAKQTYATRAIEVEAIQSEPVRELVQSEPTHADTAPDELEQELLSADADTNDDDKPRGKARQTYHRRDMRANKGK